jgi:hypothetical protein
VESGWFDGGRVNWLVHDADQRAEGSLAAIQDVARECSSLDENIS